MRFRYWILAMTVSLFASCSSDEALPAEGNGEETSDLVTEISASCGGFTAGITRGASNATTESLMIKDNNPEDEKYILGMKEFKKGNKIFILQRGPSLTPKFPGDFFDHRKDKSYHMPENIYLYEYNTEHDDANWSSGYNFKLVSDRSDPISWSKVKENGSIGNSFVFYAFCDNLKDLEPRGSEDLHPDWVGDGNDYYHHAYGGKWKKSDNVGNGYDYSNDWHAHHYQNHCGVPDFMGAYHTTSTLYSRPRFRFYHLLAYVRVTLYVPVVDGTSYKEKDPTTGKEVERPTGYNETAFVLSNEGEHLNYSPAVWIGNSASGQRNIKTRFTIDWSANRSSDKDAPLTQVLTNATTAGFVFSYCMYRHNPIDITDICYKPTAKEDYENIQEGIEEEELDVTDFVANSADARKYLKIDENGRYHDMVRRYEFSAALPAQTINSSPLMQFHVRVPGTEVDRIKNGGLTSASSPYNSYAKYTLNASNLFAGENNLELKQNTITHLHIYLPRAADEAILVKATVLPWEETFADMAVSPDEW